MSPSMLPEGEAVPADGSLPKTALLQATGQPLSAYIHIPFCATRCGYCDFNTYTAGELGDDSLTQDYLVALMQEIEQAGKVLNGTTHEVSTIFIGGGTPTLLPASALGDLIDGIEDTFGLLPGAEITTEANPETVTPVMLEELRSRGFTRISLGMQSQSAHVLKTLERRHTPDRPVLAAKWAHSVGFEYVNLDLIYGAPGESLDDWRRSLEAVVAAQVGHVSAYALIVEEGTRLARHIRSGTLPMPDDDDLADKYLLAEEILTSVGMNAYEVSNWSLPGHKCRHNLSYWKGNPWWGFGAGAHSHVGGVRWWNHKHPRRYCEATKIGSPGYAREIVTNDDRHVERVMLELRLSEGLPLAALTENERVRVADVVERGLGQIKNENLVLGLQGRLLADAVVRDLLD
ncbi:MAG: radical SAM family heme chaperone HemW [Propionibacteriaceae bacterium]